MTVSARLQTLTVDNAEYQQRLAALNETHQGLAEELATADAEASAATAAHAHAYKVSKPALPAAYVFSQNKT